MFKCLNTTIKRVDMFGQPIRLQINGEENVRSILGGFMTLCLVALIGITFGIYSKDSFFKLNPQIISSTNYTDAYGMIPLNQTIFGFRIDTDSQIDATPYFQFDTNGYKISDCLTEDPNFKTISSYNGSTLSNNFYCLDFSDSTLSVDQFYMSIFYCTNNTNCKSREEINAFLGNQKVGLSYYVLTAKLNPSNYKYPIASVNYLYNTNFRANTFIYNYLYSTPHELLTDDGLIYSNYYLYAINNSSLISIFDDSQQEKALSNNCEDNPRTCNYLVDLSFYTYQKIISYERKYKRISDALASVGGLSSIMMRVFVMFMDIYCTFIRNERIANHVYGFDFLDNHIVRNIKTNIQLKINNIRKRYNHGGSSIEISDSSNVQANKPNIFPNMTRTFNSRNVNSEDAKVDSHDVIRISNELPLPQDCPSSNIHMNQPELRLIPLDKIFVKRNQKKYRFKFYHLLVFYLCCHFNKKSQLKRQFETYKNVEIEMKSLLDIKRILHQTEGLENLKMILLNTEQYGLLNFITKYNLIENIDDSDSKNTFIIDKNFLKNEENLIKVVNEFLQKLKDNQISKIDPITSKLLDYIDINLLDINKI